MEAKIVRTRWGTNEIRLGKAWVPNETGELAIRFATHFGVVAAEDAGEDSKGRSKLRLQSPEMVVKRACDMAEQLVAKMKERGWVVDIPDLPDLPEGATDATTDFPPQQK
jgi:hypothetical protein